MAANTLAEIRELVLDRMAQASEDPMQESTRLNRAINAANRRLGRIADWPWLIEIGTVSWVYPATSFDLTTVSNYRKTKVLSYRGRPLKVVSPAEFVRFYNYPSGADVGPAYFTITSDTLRIASVPSASLDLDHIYVVDEVPMLSDMETPRLPAAYTELLVLATMKPLVMALTNTEKLNIVRAEFKEAIQEALNEVRRSTQLPQVRVDDSIWRMI